MTLEAGNDDTVETGSDDLESNINQFIAMVGSRVRKARRERGMSRRVLSEKSGVSQRYLAQLELGSGNVSIALLLKIANALGERMDTLVSNVENSEQANVSALYADAEDHVKQQVLDLLDPTRVLAKKAQRIALIGLRGAGKSTLGKLAGAHLDTPFVELNDDIEQSNGMSVNETIALYGQEGYRLLERQAIERIASSSGRVILAVAGGIVSEKETYGYLLRHYHTIWIKASPEEHMERVRAQGDERPMAGNPKAMAQLRQILTSREELYAKADTTVNTSHIPLDQSLLTLLEAIKQNTYLD